VELRRTLEEIHALYQMEPALRDLYVEGASDKFFSDWYIEITGQHIANVYTIDLIDIPDRILQKHSLHSGSNKARLIALSYEVAGSPAAAGVMCIADRDYDGCCLFDHHNACLTHTDGNSIELYALHPAVFRKFLLVALGGFSITAEHLISQCIAVLEQIYAIRAANELLKWGMLWIPFRRYISIAGSSITFEAPGFVRAYLQKNGRIQDKDVFSAAVEKVLQGFDSDPMKRMRGHDLSELLFLIVSKIRKKKQFGNSYTLESCLMATVESNDLEPHALFKSIRAFSGG